MVDCSMDVLDLAKKIRRDWQYGWWFHMRHEEDGVIAFGARFHLHAYELFMRRVTDLINDAVALERADECRCPYCGQPNPLRAPQPHEETKP